MTSRAAPSADSPRHRDLASGQKCGLPGSDIMNTDADNQPKKLRGDTPLGKVFLSYRRDDAAADAFLIFDQLNVRFPGRVFRDVSTVEPGADFVEAIENAIRSSKVLVALIGRQWLSVTDASGCRRIDNSRDFVRLEIASALKQNVVVIPVLLRGARMPSPDDLPADIVPLGRRQALDITESHLQQDIERLLRLIERQLGEEADRVRLSGMATNTGWIINLDIADTRIREICYRLDDEGEFISTGFENARSRDTGLQQPRSHFQLLGLKQNRTVFVKYFTNEGIEHGPFELHFDAEQELVRETKGILDFTRPWLSFRKWPEDQDKTLLAYFSHLVSYKNAFKQIRYSVDNDSLSRKLKFTPDWSGTGLPGIREDDETYVEIPRQSNHVCLKLYYIDGSESPVEKVTVKVDLS